MPLVSVIMNVRNGAATLREAIDSVLAQTLPGLGADRLGRSFHRRQRGHRRSYHDPRIRYFLSPEDAPLGKAPATMPFDTRPENGSRFSIRTTSGCRTSWRSRWRWPTTDVGLIYGRTVRFYPSGLERDYDHAHEYELLPEGDIFTQLFTKSCFIAMSSAVFRRSAIEAIGGIPTAIRIIPDYYLYVAVARRYRARAVQEVVCRYRMHPDSMSHAAALEMHQEVLWLIDHWAA